MFKDVVIETLPSNVWSITSSENDIHPEKKQLIKDFVADLNKNRRDCCQACCKNMIVGSCTKAISGCTLCILCIVFGLAVLAVAFLIYGIILLIAGCVESCYRSSTKKIIKDWTNKLQAFYTVSENISAQGCFETLPLIIRLRPKRITLTVTNPLTPAAPISSQNQGLLPILTIPHSYEDKPVRALNLGDNQFNTAGQDALTLGNNQFKLATPYALPDTEKITLVPEQPVLTIQTIENLPIPPVNVHREFQITTDKEQVYALNRESSIPITFSQIENGYRPQI